MVRGVVQWRGRCFLVVADPEFDAELEGAVGNLERHQLRPGVWLIRLERETGSAVSKALGLSNDRPALVTNAKFISGWAETSVIEKMQAWDAS